MIQYFRYISDKWKHHIAGSLLSGLLTEPLYLTSITVGMSSSLFGQRVGALTGEGVLKCIASVPSCMLIRKKAKQCLISLRQSLYERLHPCSSKLLAPFRLNLVSMCNCVLFV